MGEGPFRFLTDAEFNRLDVKAKARYLVQAQEALEAEQDAVRRYRENLTAQIAAIAELRGDDTEVPDPC